MAAKITFEFIDGSKFVVEEVSDGKDILRVIERVGSGPLILPLGSEATVIYTSQLKFLRIEEM